MSKQKKKTADERLIDAEGAKLFGKHVSKEKGRLLLAVTLLACAAPMLLGLRLWQQIPEVVSSGLIGTDGRDDTLPRSVLVFGLPALMMLLDLICHLQLRRYQMKMEVPPAKFRLVGRWGFPVISVLFCSGAILEAAGSESLLSLSFTAPCVLGLVLMILGGHVWDCSPDAKVALHFSFCQREDVWHTVHRIAGWIWLVVGLLVIVQTMLTGGAQLWTAAVILVALVLPVAYGYFSNLKSHN